MARKRTTFDWSADPDEPDLKVLVDRAPRRELKDELKRVAALVKVLLRLSRGERSRLPLPASALDALQELHDAKGPARKRQMNYVKRALAAEDLDRVDAALAGDGDDDVALRAAERWRTRLLEEGDAALAALLTEHPHANRQHLRSLVRARTPRPLLKALQALLTAR